MRHYNSWTQAEKDALNARWPTMSMEEQFAFALNQDLIADHNLREKGLNVMGEAMKGHLDEKRCEWQAKKNQAASPSEVQSQG